MLETLNKIRVGAGSEDDQRNRCLNSWLLQLSRLAGWKLGEHMIVLYKCIKDICSQNKKSYLSRRII